MATNKDYGIVIPFYRGWTKMGRKVEEMFKRCIDSLSISYDRLLIVDNSHDSYCKKLENKGMKIVYHPENLGCARSWNLGIKEGHEWTFVISSSMNFPHGFQSAIDALNRNDNEYILLTWNAWHCNAVSQKLIKKIGYFDENFYPARLEDSDFMRRVYFAGIEWKGATNGDGAQFETTGGESQMASASFKSGIHYNAKALGDYYEKKWGNRNPNEEAQYDLPFRDKPLDYWPKATVEQLKERYEICD